MIGAFAITSDPIIIALGLGFVGAMFVRSITVFLVRKGTLSDYVYLEHGAHWAIGALAVILLVSIGYHVNENVTGLVGVASSVPPSSPASSATARPLQRPAQWKTTWTSRTGVRRLGSACTHIQRQCS